MQGERRAHHGPALDLRAQTVIAVLHDLGQARATFDDVALPALCVREAAGGACAQDPDALDHASE